MINNCFAIVVVESRRFLVQLFENGDGSWVDYKCQFSRLSVDALFVVMKSLDILQ